MSSGLEHDRAAHFFEPMLALRASWRMTASRRETRRRRGRAPSGSGAASRPAARSRRQASPRQGGTRDRLRPAKVRHCSSAAAFVTRQRRVLGPRSCGGALGFRWRYRCRATLDLRELPFQQRDPREELLALHFRGVALAPSMAPRKMRNLSIGAASRSAGVGRLPGSHRQSQNAFAEFGGREAREP